jgi:uncharacterized alkaline shock family protein YloU
MSKIPIKIKGKVQDLQKSEREKILNSNFLLTINTNQRYPENDKDLENDIEVFDTTIQNILNNVDDYVNLPNDHKFDEHFIKNVDIDYTIEKGTKNNQLHIHIMFKFKHKTKVQLNYEKIKDKIKKDLGLQNVYMYNRLIRNSGSDNILDYINKYT